MITSDWNIWAVFRWFISQDRDSLQDHTSPGGQETLIDSLASYFVVLKHNQEQVHHYGGLVLLTPLKLPASTLHFHLGSSINFWESGPMHHVSLFICLCNYGQLLAVRATGSWILSKVLPSFWVLTFLLALPQHLKFISFSEAAVRSLTLKQGWVFHHMLELESPEHTSWPEVVLSLLNLYMCSSVLNKLYI